MIIAYVAFGTRFEYAYVQLNNYSIHKKEFDVYEPVKIGNFWKTLAQNKYICVGP